MRIEYFFLCSFVAIFCIDIRLSNPIGCSYVYVVSVLGGTGGDSLLYFQISKFSFNAKNQRNLSASEQQYLAGNALRSEIRLIHSQPYPLYGRYRRPLLRPLPSILFSRPAFNPLQKAWWKTLSLLYPPGEGIQKNTPGERIFRAKHRAEFHGRVQLQFVHRSMTPQNASSVL